MRTLRSQLCQMRLVQILQTPIGTCMRLTQEWTQIEIARAGLAQTTTSSRPMRVQCKRKGHSNWLQHKVLALVKMLVRLMIATAPWWSRPPLFKVFGISHLTTRLLRLVRRWISRSIKRPMLARRLKRCGARKTSKVAAWIHSMCTRKRVTQMWSSKKDSPSSSSFPRRTVCDLKRSDVAKTSSTWISYQNLKVKKWSWCRRCSRPPLLVVTWIFWVSVLLMACNMALLIPRQNLKSLRGWVFRKNEMNVRKRWPCCYMKMRWVGPIVTNCSTRKVTNMKKINACRKIH